jgi:hypothetical protein
MQDHQVARTARIELIKKLQAARDNRLLIAYVTSTRPGFEIQIADDAFRLFYEHLELGKDLAKNGVDLFIHSNGGSGTVPWRIVSLIRQYANHLAVLVPNSAFSAATLIALGADEIVMHKMGCLGPIDPSVANVFNPANPQNPGQYLPISVEDVTAFFRFVKEEVGITHEDELVQTVTALTDKIHPLAIGNVQRHHNQSRLLAKKLLKLHMPSEAQEPEIERLIDTLKSNLFFHGHPINRSEAKQDVKLKVVAPPQNVEDLMWDLYLQYEDRLKMTEPFNQLREYELKKQPAAATAPPTVPQIVAKMQELAAHGIRLGPQGVNEEQFVRLAAAMIPLVDGSGSTPADSKVTLDPIPGSYIESMSRADVFKVDLRIEKSSIPTPAGPQEVIKQEVLWQRWEEEQ